MSGRVGVHDEQALAPIDPDEVGVPVVGCRLRVAELVGRQQLEQPSRAADDRRVTAELTGPRATR
jgi:hypothetical protein